ncbi:MAG: hypothetical protein FWF15_04700 [Oscillospiraceae bacterium]|nr:hypothetical protein [Oscillospiraceae bacterium]
MSISFDRSKFLIGAYFFNKDLYDDAHVKEVADCGIDFLVAVDAAKPLLDLCKKYDIGMINHSNIPGWWGGDGDNAGKYKDHMPLTKLEVQKEKYADGDAIIGDYIVDEPNAKDFKHINEVIKKYSELFPGKFPFVNLYPNYASVPSNTDAEAVSQLGNATYLEHIAQYVEEIDNDYICYDFYPFTGRPYDSYIENFDIVAKACRKSKRDMWVIIQTGAWTADKILDEFQIRWQAYLSLAYGTNIIMHACYCKGWWDETTSCVNLAGNKNVTYDYAKNINEELHALGETFMKYYNTGVYVNGDITKAEAKIKPQLEWQNANTGEDILNDNIVVKADGAVFTGYFKEKCGTGSAVMLVNTNNPYEKNDGVNIILNFKNNVSATIFIKGKPRPLNKASLSLASGEGVFITF